MQSSIQTPLQLPLALNAWGRADFNSVFQQALTELDEKLLPLQQGLSYSSYADGSDLSVVVLNSQDTSSSIIVKAGIFYKGYVAGCNCSDDPTPMEPQNEYCDIIVEINKQDASASITLCED